MARRSTRLAPATTKAHKTQSSGDVVPTASITIAPMNRRVVPRSAPLPIRPGVVTFFDIPGEIRNQIYGQLLPDEDFSTSATALFLRKDAQKTSTRFMATCHQVYEEAVSILYPKTIRTALCVHVNSAGATTFLRRTTELCLAKPSDLSAITRATRLSLQVEVRKSFQATRACDVQDAMFNLAKILEGGHQLEGISLTANIGYGSFNDYYGVYGYWGMSRMHEFRNVKPGDISRAHIAAFLTDALRMIRGVKDGPKYRVSSLEFPGKTGKPWRDLNGQIYDLIRGSTAVPNYAAFTKYYDALRDLKRVYSRLVIKKTEGGGVVKLGEAFDKQVEELSKARIRGDVGVFRKLHLALLVEIDSSISLCIDFNDSTSYQMAEMKENWCRELAYLKIELEAALPGEDLDVSFRGYNIADAGLREWQTVGRKEATEAKRKRKAEKDARNGAAKKVKVARVNGPQDDKNATDMDSDMGSDSEF